MRTYLVVEQRTRDALDDNQGDSRGFFRSAPSTVRSRAVGKGWATEDLPRRTFDTGFVEA
jgi:hypothetical protein